MSETDAPSAREIDLLARVVAAETVLVQFMTLVARGEDVAARLGDLEVNLGHMRLSSEHWGRAAGWGDGPRQAAETRAAQKAQALVRAVRDDPIVRLRAGV